jgi:hypothetical protein|tara:strand:- start:82 stop:474 length:393 start_codon:yes stop_codon:yes gene_type:complete
MKKLLFTSFFIISVIFIATQPPPDKPSKYNTTDPSLEFLNGYTMTNNNPIDNFIFQYKNTILGWFGKSNNDYKTGYRSYSLASEPSVIIVLAIGKFLPYVCILVIIILFLLPNQKKEIDLTKNKDFNNSL